MEKFTELCQYAWVVLLLVSFVVCLAKGWMKKGFYITNDQAQEKELLEKIEEEKRRETIRKNGKRRLTSDDSMMHDK